MNLSRYDCANMMNSPLSIQPIPYQGSKRMLAPRICSLFPKPIDTLYEPFAGSAAITIFAATHNLANNFVIGDTYGPLVDLWKLIVNFPDKVSKDYSKLWFSQFDVGVNHFNYIREEFNEKKDPVFLLYLIARCVKNAVRFNSKGNFTQSVDRRRNGMKPERMTRNVNTVSSLLKGRIKILQGDFTDCISNAKSCDFIYLDPPYQGTTYGIDKRYAAGLEREQLISALHNLNDRDIPYILSYDGQTGDKIYGTPLPETISANHLTINAGRSSQATLSGFNKETIESLYVSKSTKANSFNSN